MDLIVYDSELNELGIIDEFKSLVWTLRFYEAGSFELRAPMTENNIALLRKNRYLYRPDAEETVFIKSISETLQDGERLIIVSGAFLEGLLDKRTITHKGYSSSMRDTLKKYIEDIQGYYSFGYPGMSVEIADDEDINKWDMESVIGKNLGDYTRSLLRAENRAVKIDFYPSEKRMICRVVSGADRTDVVFSSENLNLYNTEYNYSEEGCYSLVECFAVVKDEEAERDPAKEKMLYAAMGGRDYSGSQQVSGLELTNYYEVIEAVIVKEEKTTYDDEGNPQTVIIKKVDYETTHENLLAICKQHYQPYTENFSGTAVGGGFRSEWHLGDIVTIEDTARGTSYQKQIEEVTEVFEAGTKRVDVLFGAPMRTVIDLIKEVKR